MSSIVQPFKYRSITSIQKQKILESRREELEIEHFSMSQYVEVMESLEPTGDESTDAQRKEQVDGVKERLVVLESMAEAYNRKLLDIREEHEKEEA